MQTLPEDDKSTEPSDFSRCGIISSPPTDITSRSYDWDEDPDEEHHGSTPALTGRSESLSCVSSSDERIQNAAFLLMLTEGKHLSQVALDDVIKGSRRIAKQAVSKVKEGVLGVLSDVGINVVDIPGLENVLSSSSDPFEKLNTPYLREKFYREHFNYTVCYYVYPIEMIPCYMYVSLFYGCDSAY